MIDLITIALKFIRPSGRANDPLWTIPAEEQDHADILEAANLPETAQRRKQSRLQPGFLDLIRESLCRSQLIIVNVRTDGVVGAVQGQFYLNIEFFDRCLASRLTIVRGDAAPHFWCDSFCGRYQQEFGAKGWRQTVYVSTFNNAQSGSERCLMSE
ncbi:hypothetical protein HFN55_29720 [Rhizobium leguminosarum]|nr:hypothetical protein [Rhizobium leguminosarum]